jgi:GNAT superfamily N-acetyltransferase
MPLDPVPAGHLAAVVTLLEMRKRPSLRAMPISSLSLSRWQRPALAAYRALFRRIGEPWLWYSRLELDDDALAALIYQAQTQIYAVLDPSGIEVGILELTHPEPNCCSLDFLGLVPELSGKGEGKWLMANALNLAWQKGVESVRVHSCTLDHPAALRFYQREGFVAIGREVETFPDPRLTGLIPREAAPHIPIIA